ncbi:MAG: hypothetical protein WAL88_08350, partial [Nitrosotalea sp.]
MTIPNPNDFTVDHSKFDYTKSEYENMSFGKRFEIGRRIDRSAENFLAGFFPSIVQTQNEKDPTIFQRYIESTM